MDLHLILLQVRFTFAVIIILVEKIKWKTMQSMIIMQVRLSMTTKMCYKCFFFLQIISRRVKQTPSISIYIYTHIYREKKNIPLTLSQLKSRQSICDHMSSCMLLLVTSVIEYNYHRLCHMCCQFSGRQSKLNCFFFCFRCFGLNQKKFCVRC